MRKTYPFVNYILLALKKLIEIYKQKWKIIVQICKHLRIQFSAMTHLIPELRYHFLVTQNTLQPEKFCQ